MSERTGYREPVRPSPEVVAGFRQILQQYSPSCLIADARLRAGTVGGFSVVRPEQKVAGPVLTVDLNVDELVDCPTVLTRARPGDVVLLAGHGQTATSMWGGLMSTLAQRVGIAGTVADGAVRDIDEIRDLNYPLWYRAVAPRPSPTFLHGRTEPVGLNVAVVVAGLVIRPGDIIVGDENGIAVVPREQAEQVLAATQLVISKEDAIRDKIESGISVADLLAEFVHM